MKDRKQALWGILLAVLTSLIILGGVLLSLAENRFGLLAANTPTRPVMEEEMPTLVFILPVVATQTAGSTAEFNASPTPTASLTPLSGCPLPPGWTAIILQNDESSEAIAVRYGISAQELAAGNCWDYPLNTLMAGTSIYVPSGEVMISPTAGAWCRPQGESACVPVLVSTTSPTYTPTPTCHKRTGWYAYTVRSGETLYSLSRIFGVSVKTLQQANCMGNSTALRTGQTLYVPYPPPPPAPPTWTPRPPLPPYRSPTPTFRYIPPSHTPAQPPIVYPTLQQTPPYHFPTATQEDVQPPLPPPPVIPNPGSTPPGHLPTDAALPPPIPAVILPVAAEPISPWYTPI